MRMGHRRLQLGCCLGLLLGIGSTTAAVLPDAEVTEYEASEIQRELNRFEAVGDGIVLTLAACDEEPHCITAMSDHELARLIDRIQLRIDHLEAVEEAGGLASAHAAFLARYRVLRDRYADYLRQLRVVGQRINPDDLEGAWEDSLDFGFADFAEPVDAGPDVPSPNERITLDRFQDADQPMPID